MIIYEEISGDELDNNYMKRVAELPKNVQAQGFYFLATIKDSDSDEDIIEKDYSDEADEGLTTLLDEKEGPEYRRIIYFRLISPMSWVTLVNGNF